MILTDIHSEQMEPWQVLERAIPDRTSKIVAAAMHVHQNYVLAWRREPLSHEAPLATGMASPLSRVCELITAVFAVNPRECALIPEHIRLHYQLLVEAHRIAGFRDNEQERALTSADLLTKAIAAVNSLNLEGVNDDTLRHLVLLRTAVDNAISRVGKDLSVSPE